MQLDKVDLDEMSSNARFVVKPLIDDKLDELKKVHGHLVSLMASMGHAV